MKDFTLVLRGGADLPCETVGFQAIDPACALAIAHRHSHIGSADLWEGDKPLCSLTYTSCGFWIVTPLSEA